jgi:hypothetical protein
MNLKIILIIIIAVRDKKEWVENSNTSAFAVLPALTHRKQMSLANVLASGINNGNMSGHSFKDIHIGGSAKAHLGDTYHFGAYTLNNSFKSER